MKAVGNYLVIKEIKEKTTKTKGGLLLTDKIKEDIRYRQGVVKSVGSLVQGVKSDDKIYYDKKKKFIRDLVNKSYWLWKLVGDNMNFVLVVVVKNMMRIILFDIPEEQ